MYSYLPKLIFLIWVHAIELFCFSDVFVVIIYVVGKRLCGASYIHTTHCSACNVLFYSPAVTCNLISTEVNCWYRFVMKSCHDVHVQFVHPSMHHCRRWLWRNSQWRVTWPLRSLSLQRLKKVCRREWCGRWNRARVRTGGAWVCN